MCPQTPLLKICLSNLPTWDSYESRAQAATGGSSAQRKYSPRDGKLSPNLATVFGIYLFPVWCVLVSDKVWQFSEELSLDRQYASEHASIASLSTESILAPLFTSERKKKKNNEAKCSFKFRACYLDVSKGLSIPTFAVIMGSPSFTHLACVINYPWTPMALLTPFPIFFPWSMSWPWLARW